MDKDAGMGLTDRRLNRATLGRQLLLAGFDPADLDAAFADRRWSRPP
jgi:hypothetical protein